MTSISNGVESAFASETGAVIPADMLVESNPASDTLARQAAFMRWPVEYDATSDTLSRQLAAIRGMAEYLVLDDSLSVRVIPPVQFRHVYGVPGRTKTGEAPVH